MNVQNRLVSVVVPVYNVEKYLAQCVRSITNQTYRNIEVILVDDGSPDRCPQMCDEFAKADSRIKVVHKVNGGLSDARNVGVEHATGEYLMFVDSDDFWREDACLEKLVNYMDEYDQPDFIGFNISYYYPSEDYYQQWEVYGDDIVNETDRDKLICKLVTPGRFPISACCKIINRQFYNRQKIRFIKGVISEDIPWFIELLDKSKNFRIVNDYIYCYRQEVSTSITKNFSIKTFDDLFGHVTNIEQFLNRSSFSEQARNALYSFLAYEWCILLASLRSITDKAAQNDRRSKLKDYRWLLNYTCNIKVRKTARIYRIAGFAITECALRYYLTHRKNA